MKRVPYRARTLQGANEWAYGSIHYGDQGHNLIDFIDGTTHPVNMDTVGACTGLVDKNNEIIYEGDVVCAELPDGRMRLYEAVITTVIREVVEHSGLVPMPKHAEITGVVFRNNGYERFPDSDKYSPGALANMQVVGNIHDVSRRTRLSICSIECWSTVGSCDASCDFIEGGIGQWE